ncbi:histone-fold-containing protein, partial [Paraphysoderma sedebokerense]
MMPDDIACAKETRDLLMDCCVEFIHLISSEANEICEKESKKTIAAEHVISALQSLGFEGFVPEIQEVYREHKQSLKEREKKVTKF